MTVCKLGDYWGAVFSRALIITAAVAAALALQAQESRLSQTGEHTSGKGDTASCIKEAAQMNMGVVKIAQLASEKAQSSELKRFSQQLEKDHKKAQEKLETIARKHDVTLPTSLDPKCQEELTRLQALSGDEFDKEFAKGAVQGHAMAVAHLQEVSREVEEADLKQYMRDMLSQVKEHQRQARQVAKAVGLDQATIASLETTPPEGVGTPGAGTQIDRGTGDDPQERQESSPPRP